MSYQRISDSIVTAKVLLTRVAVGCMIVSVGACSSTQSDSDVNGSSWKLWGNDKTAAAPQYNQQHPSSFDADAPAGQQPVYRGGRDPVSGRAQEWPPAAPHYGGPQQATAVERSALNPLPPAVPYAAQPASPRTAYAPPPPASYAPGAPARGSAAGSASVEVKSGDTLYRIAKANNVTVPALMQANSLSNESIKVGQRLTIPAR